MELFLSRMTPESSPRAPGTLCTCEGVRMHLRLWVLLAPPTLGGDVVLGLAGSDDVTQEDVFWRATDSLTAKLQTLVFNLRHLQL